MTIPLYLAMTAEEYAICDKKPGHIAWMACHFSPYNTGITNLPPQLPADAMVILNDRIPIDRHDPMLICKQLESIGCSSILLDLQRPNIPETEQLVTAILNELSCPVGVSLEYAGDLNCPVFLPPVPPHIPIREYLHTFVGREIWLDAGLYKSTIHVDENGATITYSDSPDKTEHPFHDDALCCSYAMEIREKDAVFTLQRRKEDLEKLLEVGNTFGVTKAIGLYQELK